MQRDMCVLHPVLLLSGRYKTAVASPHHNTESTEIDDTALHEETAPETEKWTLATAQRVEPATAEDPALAPTVPAPNARRAAALAAHLAAVSAPLAACAKEKHVTPAAVSEESAASAVHCPVMMPECIVLN